MVTPHETIIVKVRPVRDQLLIIQEVLQAFQKACTIVGRLAIKHRTRHPMRLQNLSYPELCPKKPEPGDFKLPSQYAIRACNRIAHQLRLEKDGNPDPYPDRSFDVDSRLLSYDRSLQAISITTLAAIGVRGRPARDGVGRIKLAVSFDSKENKDLFETGRFLGGHVVVTARKAVLLIARIEPCPPKEEDLAPGHA